MFIQANVDNLVILKNKILLQATFLKTLRFANLLIFTVNQNTARLLEEKQLLLTISLYIRKKLHSILASYQIYLNCIKYKLFLLIPLVVFLQ